MPERLGLALRITQVLGRAPYEHLTRFLRQNALLADHLIVGRLRICVTLPLRCMT